MGGTDTMKGHLSSCPAQVMACSHVLREWLKDNYAVHNWFFIWSQTMIGKKITSW